MKRNVLLLATSGCLFAASGAFADDQAGPTPALTTASSAPAAMTTPSMTPPLSADPNPFGVDAGPLGKIYVTGAVSALFLTQTNAVSGDRASWGDISNAQVFIQNTTGFVQFFVQAGAYSLPDLGTVYVKASTLTPETYGYVPQAFVKLVPNNDFSIMIGKLPSLWGAESTFSFENTDIEHGLIWNQTNGVNRGVQVNYAKGPLTVLLSVNDGFYSGRYDWGSALVSLAIDSKDLITFDAAGDYFGHSRVATFVTPLALDNSQVYGLMWTHTAGPLMVMPYTQYTFVPAVPAIGLAHEASTIGFGVIGKYSLTPAFALGARGEYISTNGTAAQGAPNLLFGPGSKGWSLTLTPAYQFKIFFLRGEVSYVRADSLTPGFGFGRLGESANQARALIETGVLF